MGLEALFDLHDIPFITLFGRISVIDEYAYDSLKSESAFVPQQKVAHGQSLSFSELSACTAARAWSLDYSLDLGS